MTDCHLPTAVRYQTATMLQPLDDGRLGELLNECRNWTVCIEAYRALLTTAAGRTEWHVQTRRDRAEVAEATVRLKAEIERRLDAPLHSMLFGRQGEVSELALA